MKGERKKQAAHTTVASAAVNTSATSLEARFAQCTKLFRSPVTAARGFDTYIPKNANNRTLLKATFPEKL